MRAKIIKRGLSTWGAAGLCLILTAGTLALSSCKSGAGAGARTFRMGERAQAGPLIYTVLDAEWKSHLGETSSTKYPTHRFLVIRLTVTNSGAAEVSAPHLTVEDARGNSHPEVTDGEAVPEWLGVLRRIRPAETEQGRIAFDVPPGVYYLRVTDDAEPGQERAALVEIPLRLESEPALPVTPVPPPQPK